MFAFRVEDITRGKDTSGQTRKLWRAWNVGRREHWGRRGYQPPPRRPPRKKLKNPSQNLFLQARRQKKNTF